MYISREQAERELAEYRKLRFEYARMRDPMRDFSKFRLSLSGGYLSCVTRTSRERTYIGPEPNSEIREMQMRRYVDDTIAALDKKIAALEKFISNFTVYDPFSIYESMPAAYRFKFERPVDIFRERNPDADAWLEQMMANRAKYPPRYPEAKKHRTITGEYVRSKDELIVHNHLHLTGRWFLYENPIFINGVRIDPDFTILNPRTMEVIYHEHAGLTSNDGYSESFAKKLVLLSKGNIYSPHNLIITTETEGQEFDLFNYDKMLSALLD